VCPTIIFILSLSRLDGEQRENALLQCANEYVEKVERLLDTPSSLHTTSDQDENLILGGGVGMWVKMCGSAYCMEKDIIWNENRAMGVS
jgi:hypothetical protein